MITRKEVDTIKAFSKSAENKSKKLIFSDSSNKDVYKKNLTGKIFVLPSFKFSDVNSMVLLSVCRKKLCPKCFLFSEKLDDATISAFIACKTFLGSDMVVIDSLGQEFLQTIEKDDELTYSDEYVAINI